MEHIHKWKRILKNGRKTKEFGCIEPTCQTTFGADYLVGKLCLCGYCGNEMIITRKNLNKQSIIHCYERCSKRVKPKAVPDAINAELAKIFGESNGL